MGLYSNKDLIASLLDIASIVESRDAYTGGHLWRVSRYSKLLAEKVGLSTEGVFVASLGGFLHDLGKMGIPDAILLKKGRLTDSEFDVIKTHPEIGHALIKNHPLAPLVLDAIYHHHEWCNGQGYPQGLKKDELSIFARIIAITDAFDAMTSERPYRRRMSVDAALSRLEEVRDTQFDGELIDYFKSLGDSGELAHIVGHSDDDVSLVTCPECGPIITIKRDTKDYDHIFCSHCKGKFSLRLVNGSFNAEFVNVYGNADQVKPFIDRAVIEDFLKQIPPQLTVTSNMSALKNID